MFKVDKIHTIIEGLGRISSAYTVLIKDEVPMLYSGLNKYDSRIIGSVVCESDDGEVLRYFHVIVEEEQYIAFLSRKVALLDLMKMAKSFFVVDKKYSGEIILETVVQIEDIPKDYLPLPNSYCPIFATIKSTEFAFSLKGGQADDHKVDPNVLSRVQDSVTSAIKEAFVVINEVYQGEVFIRAYKTGSFRIHFGIEVKHNVVKPSMFKSNQDDALEYINSFVSYVFRDLPNKQQAASGLASIEKMVMGIFDKEALTYNDSTTKGIKESLIKAVQDLDELKPVLEESHSNIEVINIGVNGEELGIGMINKEFFEEVESSELLSLYEADEISQVDIIETDPVPKEYKVIVYLFNVGTGKGGVNVLYEDDTTESKVTLHVISGERRDYYQTVFTDSEHNKKYITIKAIGTKKNGRLKKLVAKIEDNIKEV